MVLPYIAAGAVAKNYEGKRGTSEKRGQLATNLMYTNPITASAMAIPGVRGAVRSFGRGRDDPMAYNYGYTTANPYAQRYGGTVSDAIQRNPNLTQQELDQLVLQQEEAAARKQQEDQINAYFADPTRLKRYEQDYDAELAQSKDALGQQTQAAMRRQAQNQARAGTMGGSTDIENRAGLSGMYQSTLSDLGSRRAQASQAQSMSDVNAKTSLLGLVNSADPFGAQAAKSRLGGLAGEGAAAQGYIRAGLQRDLAGQTGDNLQSEAIGSGLSGFARGLGTYSDRRARGGYSTLWG